jgi:zinc protease
MKRLFILFSFLLVAIYANAQQDLKAPVPVDPDYRIGKLPNGLTYYIRHNSEPEKRASYYIIQNVGALLENDSQNGLAHFLEHMSFNGTQHFPGKAIISSLEKHGVAFGYNINAYTSWDETVYNLSDVPVDANGLVDSCLTILGDWSHYLTLDGGEIDKERGVILEEWRTRRTADWRLLNQTLPFLFKDSKYAVRDVIGDTAVIRHFNYETLRNYYHDWYRPDLQAIAIVGDINVDEVEAKIKSIFASIPAPENAQKRPQFLVPEQKGTRYLLATDPEASETSVSFYILDSNPDNSPRDEKFLRDEYVTNLMNAMLRNRINELLQKGNPPFISGAIYYGNYLPRNYNLLEVSATARDKEEATAFEAIMTEMERANRYGFTQGELDRVKASSLADFDNRYKQKDKIKNDRLVNDVKENFLTGEPLASMDFLNDFMKQVYPTITIAEISEKFKSLIKDDNRAILVQGPSGEGANHLTEAEALAIIDKVKHADIKPYEDITGGNSLIKEELPGGKVVKTTLLPQFSATEWVLSNGAKVVYRKADFEKDNISLNAYAMGGSSMYADTLVPSLSLFSTVVSMYGAGDYDNVALQKMLAGKKASVSLGLNETSQTITGSTTPKDFETMMQLLYLRFAKPNFNKEAYDAIMGRFSAMIAAAQKDPTKAMSDTLTQYMTNHSPRSFIFSPESLKKISFQNINYVYSTAFDNASRFTFFIVGNVEEDQAKAMAEKYIGSLPTKVEKENWIDRKVSQPKGIVDKEITLPLAVPKGTVVIVYSAKTKYIPQNYLAFEALNGILDIVYTDKVREEQGGTYGVGVNAASQIRPQEKTRLLVSFDCDPARATELKKIIYDELNNIATVGPKQVDLDKSVSNILKKREEDVAHNSYWSNVLQTYYNKGININDEKNFQAILKAMTVKDIQKITKKYLTDADKLEIVFLPEKK